MKTLLGILTLTAMIFTLNSFVFAAKKGGNIRIGISLTWMFILLLCISGCSNLVVRNLNVNWDQTNKTARAEIANIGYRDAGNFLVYFNGDENPVSQNHRP